MTSSSNPIHYLNFIIFSFSQPAAHTPVERTILHFWSYQGIIKNQSLHYISHTVHHVLHCPFIHQLLCTILGLFTHILFLAHKYTTLYICEKNTIFNRQLMITHKYLMFCGRLVIGLKLPGDGSKQHRNVWDQELISEWRNTVKCTTVGRKNDSAVFA